VQDVTFEIGLSTRATVTGPGFATNVAASDALRYVQVPPPAAGADVCVAAAVVLPAFVAPDDVVIDDAVKVALVTARTDAAAAMLGLLLLDPHPETAVARASRTAPAIILFMFDSFARCLCTGARRIAGSHRGCPSL